MEVITKHTIREIQDPVRLLDYVIRNLPELSSRNGAKKAIKNGHLILDGKKVESGRFVLEGQELVLYKETPKFKKVFEQKLDVIFEDEFLAVVFKPPGIGTSGNYFRTLENALPFNLTSSSANDALPYSMPVHRLDNPTSGLIIVAKTKTTRITLGTHFEQGLISKTYHALIHGELIGNGEVRTPVDEKDAWSSYETIQSQESIKFNQLSLVKLIPYTGRTHQLRIHMASLGTPIVGDELYTKQDELYQGKGLFLSSTGIAFKHPITQEKLVFEHPIPRKFMTLIKHFSNHF